MKDRDATQASSSDMIREARDRFYGHETEADRSHSALQRRDGDMPGVPVVMESSPGSVATDTRDPIATDWSPAGPAPAPTPVPGARSRVMRTLGRFLIPALIAAGFAVNSAIDDTKPIDALSVGDCLLDPEGEEITSVEVKSCDEPHVYEVFAVVEYGASTGDAYPGDSTVSDVIFQRCIARYEPYVGIAYERSAFWTSAIYPSDESWADGDRAGWCLVSEGDPAVTRTGSLRGADG